METLEITTAGWIRGETEVETVTVALRFDPGDACAVQLDITGTHTQEVWSFSRDLLSDGLRSMVAVGQGDVTVQATSITTEIGHTDAVGRRTMLRLPWWSTREFVRLSLLAVPRGQEEYDVDSWLAHIVGPPGRRTG